VLWFLSGVLRQPPPAPVVDRRDERADGLFAASLLCGGHVSKALFFLLGYLGPLSQLSQSLLFLERLLGPLSQLSQSLLFLERLLLGPLSQLSQSLLFLERLLGLMLSR
jgi:hypothetical protein